MGGEMVQMFGVMPNNPDSWLQEKGQEVGREVMGKLMQAVYQADGMEAPADAIGKLLPPLCVCISRIYGPDSHLSQHIVTLYRARAYTLAMPSLSTRAVQREHNSHFGGCCCT